MEGRKWATGAAVAAAFLGGLGGAVMPAGADPLSGILRGATGLLPTGPPPLGGGSGGQPPAQPPAQAPPGVPVVPNATVAPPAAGAPPARRRKGRGTLVPDRQNSGAGPAPKAPTPPHTPASRTTVPAVAPSAPVLPGGVRQANGVPTLGNPGLSLALPGAAPLGVPDFFIDTFRIPPFLLPIFQAAGTQYGVPWQVLAAINEIETDYGRNLSVSSAGAEGWMQFLPETFKRYGVDANGDGKKDPYNPQDAIFSAARYLQAAGAQRNLHGAIFAYNHAEWYVQSVLLRAKLIGGLPQELVGALSELTQGRFPVAAPARYADDMRDAALHPKTARKLGKGGLPGRNATNIYARPGSPVIAAQDGQIVELGQSAARGRYLVLEDGYGNRYGYEHLGALAKDYPTLHNVARNASADSGAGTPAAPDSAPGAPATAGAHSLAPTSAPTAQSSPSPTLAPLDAGVSSARARLFANPARPNAFSAGGRDQLDRGRPSGGDTSLPGLLSRVLALPGQSVAYRRLAPGARVLAGTILGRVGPGQGSLAPHLRFSIRPAGTGSPLVDPKPILDGWKLLEATAIYRTAGQNPLISGPLAVGQIFLSGKDRLERTVLADPRIDLSQCERRDVEAGLVDRRPLATLAYLSASGLRPRVSALGCGQRAADAATGDPAALAALTAPLANGTTGPAGAGPTAATPGPASPTLKGLIPAKPGPAKPLPEVVALDIAAVDGIPIRGHQGAGSITDVAIRRLLALQGVNRPHEIVSLMHYPGSDNTIALPDHADRIHVGFSTLIPTDPAHLAALDTSLRPDQWIKLINRLNAIPEPSSRAPSAASGPPSGGPGALSVLPGLAGLPGSPSSAAGRAPVSGR